MRWLGAVAVTAASLVPSCGGCTPVQLEARPAAGTPGQPVELVAVATSGGEPVAGLGLRFDEEYRDSGRVRIGTAVADAAGVARLVVADATVLRPLSSGDVRLGYRAVFAQGDPDLARRADLCSARSEVVPLEVG